MKQNPLFKRLKGFQKAQRNRFLLMTNHKLTQEEFLLYELGLALVDWDENHDTYESFYGTNKEIADILGWKSDSTVSRHKDTLIKKGFFVPVGNKRIKPLGFDQWQLRKTYSPNAHVIPAETQTFAAKTQGESAKMQTIQSQNPSYPLVSYKDECSLLRTDEEYKKILIEGDYTILTIEDMKWIDMNVKENPAVPS